MTNTRTSRLAALAALALCGAAAPALAQTGAASELGAPSPEPDAASPPLGAPDNAPLPLGEGPGEGGPAAPPTPIAPPDAPVPDAEARPSAEQSARRAFARDAGGVWILDDGIGADAVPWDDFDPATEYGPPGNVHFGVQGRFAALPGGPMPLPDGPLIELGGFVDVRYSMHRPWHLRIAVAASFQTPADENLGAGVHTWTSPFALRLRVQPFAVDLGSWFTFRAGGEIGAQYVPRRGGDGRLEVLPAASGELVVHLLEDRLEVGVIGGIQWSALGETTRTGFYTRLEAEAVIGATVGYLLQ